MDWWQKVAGQAAYLAQLLARNPDDGELQLIIVGVGKIEALLNPGRLAFDNPARQSHGGDAELCSGWRRIRKATDELILALGMRPCCEGRIVSWSNEKGGDLPGLDDVAIGSAAKLFDSGASIISQRLASLTGAVMDRGDGLRFPTLDGSDSSRAASPGKQVRVVDFMGEREFVIPTNESPVGDVGPLLLDIEARTNTRLRNGLNPMWYLRLHRDFTERRDAAANISFADYCARRHPGNVELVGIESGFSEPKSPSEWEKITGLSWRTLSRRIKDDPSMAIKVNTKSWKIRLSEVPKVGSN